LEEDGVIPVLWEKSLERSIQLVIKQQRDLRKLFVFIEHHADPRYFNYIDHVRTLDMMKIMWAQH